MGDIKHLINRSIKAKRFADGGDVDIGGALPEAYQNPNVGVAPFLANMVKGIATLPKRALDASAADVEHYRQNGFGDRDYVPQTVGPAAETALMTMGTGAGARGGFLPRGVDPLPPRAYTAPHDLQVQTAPAGEAAGEAAGDVGGGLAGSPGGGEGASQAGLQAKRRAAGLEPLPGLPTQEQVVGGELFTPGPVGSVHDVADRYMANRELPSYHKPPEKYHDLDKEHSAAIARAYDEMEHAPHDPAVKASYEALIKESLAQYRAIKDSGLKITPVGAADYPYHGNPREVAKDVADNNHMAFFKTSEGFGSDGLPPDPHHPMMQPSGEKIGEHEMLNNDIFRVVHDYFGHIKNGYGFRAAGEDNAWRSHAAMYSDLARPAMTSETRGQNSWVNYGPHGEANRTASGADTIYADQKVGLMPEWTMRDRGSPEPTIAYHGSPYSFDRFDTSRIGTGEGNQGYGHGLYFAGHSPVSEWYRHQLSARRDPLLPKYGLDAEDGANVGMQIAAHGGDVGAYADTLTQHLDILKKNPDTSKAHRNEIARTEGKLRFLRDPERNPGHMYQVAIDHPPEKFLDYDRPLSEQSQSVKDALGKTDYLYHADRAGKSNATGGDFLTNVVGDHLSGSRTLAEAGIPGVRYLDQGSRSKGQGTHNYVTFDAPRLLKRYADGGGIAPRHFADGGAPDDDGAMMPETFVNPMVKRGIDSIASLPQRAFESSEAMRRGEGYDPGPVLEAATLPMGTGAIAGLPMRAGEVALGAGPIRAYHSSPHDFDRFDMAKVGTGEGAQVYGHGLYFAENPKVSGQGGEYWQQFKQRFGNDERGAADELRAHGFDREKAIAASKKNIGELQDELSSGRFAKGSDDELSLQLARGYHDSLLKQRLAEHEFLTSGKPVGPRTYEADINADPAKMLHWDQPLEKQNVWEKLPADVRNSIDEALDARGHNVMSDVLESYTGKNLYQALKHEDVHESLPPVIGNSDWYKGNTSEARHASEFLNSLDIPGIKYLDQLSRPGSGGMNSAGMSLREPPKTSNYVMFNDKLIDIRKKYADGGVAPRHFADGGAPDADSFGWGKVGEAMPEHIGRERIMDPIANSAISMATLPRRAIENSQRSLETGEYDPGPVLEAATLPLGAGVAGVPVRGAEAVLGAGAIRKAKGAAGAHLPPRYFEGDPVVNAGVDAPISKKIQTVAAPYRMMYPGIYRNPRVIAEEAAARVGEEDPAMKQLFGVTRGDLHEMNVGRVGNEEPNVQLAQRFRGSEAAQNIQTPENTQRLLDILTEAGKHEGLARTDAWYLMDPVFQRMKQMFGTEEAVRRYKLLNTTTGMASPGSEVLTEIQRGTGAHWLHNEGRFDDFAKYAGLPESNRGAMPADMRYIIGHPYHSTSQAGPMRRYLESGELVSDSPKVPLYTHASGVPETGFQTKGPVGDAHFSRGVGLADTRKGPTDVGASFSRAEYQTLQPWWQHQVAGQAGIESVPAQARLWNVLGPQTGVESELGAPKLELLAKQIMKASRRLGVSPEKARDLILSGKAGAGALTGAALVPSLLQKREEKASGGRVGYAAGGTPTSPDLGSFAQFAPKTDSAPDLGSFSQFVPQPMSAEDVASGVIENAPSSAMQFLKDTARAVVHPVDTLGGIKDLGLGLLEKSGAVGTIFPGTGGNNDSHIKYADAMGGYLKDRYGGWENIKRSVAKDPVGVLGDASMILTGGGSAAERLPGVLGKTGEVMSKVGRATDPLMAPVNAARVGTKAVGELMTHTGATPLENAYRTGVQGGEAGEVFRDQMRGTGDMTQPVTMARQGLEGYRQARAANYRQGMEGITSVDRQMNPFDRVLDFGKIEEAVDKAKSIQTFKGQVLDKGANAVRNDMIAEIDHWKSLPPGDYHTIEGLDALKRSLGHTMMDTAPGTAARKAAGDIYNAVRNTIVNYDPKYAVVMKQYEQASGMVRELERAMSLGEKASADTALRKLQSIMRNNVNTNYGRRLELGQLLQENGAKHLMAALSGQALNAWAPRGLGKLVPELAVVGAAGHFVSPLSLAALPFMSPRLMGEAAHGLGRTVGRVGEASNRVLGNIGLGGNRTVGNLSYRAGRATNPFENTDNPYAP